MAPAAAVNDPPVSVREKSGRLVIVFNVANVKSGSVQVEHHPASEDEPAGSISVTFSAVSPNKTFQKQLVLPHGIDTGKTVKDVQSKSLTIQLVKLDPDLEWGQAWLKPKGKSKRKGAPPSPSAGPSSSPASPVLAASKPLKGLDDMDDDFDDQLEEQLQDFDKERERLERERKEQEKEQERKEQEKKEQERKERERKQEEKKEQERKAQAKKEQEKKAKEKKEQEKKEQDAKKEVEKASQEVDEESKASGKAKARRGGKAKKKAETVEEPEAKPAVETKEAPEPVKAKKAPKRSARSRGPAKAEAAESKDDKGFGLMPPADPAVQNMVSEATATWPQDPKKATVLFRLAGRKGYYPAYLLLAQLANNAKDDALMIETFCTMLTTPDVEKQMPKELLSNCAMQLASALRDPRNKAQVSAYDKELKQIADAWPIVNTVRVHDESFEDVRNAIAQKQQELNKLRQTSSELESSKTNFEDLRSKLGLTQQLDKEKEQKAREAKADFDRIKSHLNAEAARAEQGSWHDEGSSWRFVATVPSLLRLSDGKLDVSNSQVKMTGPDRTVLVSSSTPQVLDAGTAQASWSKKHHRLEVVYQKPVLEPSPPPQEDVFDEMD